MFSENYDLIRKLENPIPVGERKNYSIKDVKQDGFILLYEKPYHVQPFGKYFDDEEEWFELRITNIETGESTFLEWKDDDELELTLTTKELKFCDLFDDEKEEIDSDDLAQITDDEDDIFFLGKKFEYEDDYKAEYLRFKDGRKFRVKMYEFEANDGSCITIENWLKNDERSDYEIWLSNSIKLKSFEILSLGSN
ncbi:MAG: DUF4178 domain-containing protein [Candidatus Cloacimonetes bacterium]|nr:DUF4178 domain-containing protein [Candidatus Cloacimonadota bacterium]